MRRPSFQRCAPAASACAARRAADVDKEAALGEARRVALDELDPAERDERQRREEEGLSLIHI